MKIRFTIQKTTVLIGSRINRKESSESESKIFSDHSTGLEWAHFHKQPWLVTFLLST